MCPRKPALPGAPERDDDLLAHGPRDHRVGASRATRDRTPRRSTRAAPRRRRRGRAGRARRGPVAERAATRRRCPRASAHASRATRPARSARGSRSPSRAPRARLALDRRTSSTRARARRVAPRPPLTSGPMPHGHPTLTASARSRVRSSAPCALPPSRRARSL